MKNISKTAIGIRVILLSIACILFITEFIFALLISRSIAIIFILLFIILSLIYILIKIIKEFAFVSNVSKEDVLTGTICFEQCYKFLQVLHIENEKQCRLKCVYLMKRMKRFDRNRATYVVDSHGKAYVLSIIMD